MLSAPRDAADQQPGQNKNRGTQVVKLSVPFFVFICAQCRTRALCAAQRMQSKPECCILPRKREYGMEEWNGALADVPFFGAERLEIANQRCENRIP